MKQGSSGMYADYDNLVPKKDKLILKIANSRGKKPVMREIKKARDIINGLLTELNPSEGKAALSKVDTLLWNVLHDNDIGIKVHEILFIESLYDFPCFSISSIIL